MALEVFAEDSSSLFAPGAGAQTVSRMQHGVDFLLSSPSCADIARHLVVHHHDDLTLAWAHFFHLDEDAHLRDIGHFGTPREVAADFDDVSLWQASAPAEAARFNRVVIVNSLSLRNHSGSECSELKESDATIVAFPLASTQKVFGSVAFGVAGVPFIETRLIRELKVCVDLISVYLGSRTADENATYVRESANGEGIDVAVPASHKRRPSPKVPAETFTERNVAILRLLADGLTYEQIASRIGFSHSTVRTDLMKIYQMLGVSTRDAAVARAVDQGIVRSLAPETRARLELVNPVPSPAMSVGQLQLL